MPGPGAGRQACSTEWLLRSAGSPHPPTPLCLWNSTQAGVARHGSIRMEGGHGNQSDGLLRAVCAALHGPAHCMVKPVVTWNETTIDVASAGVSWGLGFHAKQQ